MNKNLSELADRLRNLYQALEAQRDTGKDWSLARTLEDRIGSGQPIGDDIERAEALLACYGRG